MLVPVNLLKTYVSTKLEPAELGERFLMTSSELEKITNLAVDAKSTFDYVFVGFVKEVSAHPNADRLRVCKVDVGDKGIVQIVCGAPNVTEGMYAAVALPGAIVKWHGGEEVEIKATSLRGVESFGMLCAAEELGLAIKHEDGLWPLEKAKPGMPLLQATGLNDAVLDLEITPNRPDLLSFEGLAREVHAFDHRQFSPIAPSIANYTEAVTVDLTIDANSGCTRLSGLAVEIISLPQYSPWWLQRALLLSGLKSISPIVDVTNFVMLELGQPLHAYDLKSLGSPALTAKRNHAVSEFVGLDDCTRKLEIGDLIITHKRIPVGLAGIMGGASSAITESTKTLLLEAAAFEAGSIRRTSRRLGLRTEASTRFEKGVDPASTIRALQRAVELLAQIGEIRQISAIADTGPTTKNQTKLHFTPEEFESIIGARVSVPEARRIVEALGFSVTSASKSRLVCIAPSWREDVTRTEDLYEEIVRIWGFERVPSTLPKGTILGPQPNLYYQAKIQTLRKLVGLGFQTIVSQPFIGDRELENSGIYPKDALPLANPLSSLQSLLSPVQIPLHLSLIYQNQRDDYSRYAELSSTFTSRKPHERELLTITIRGPKSEQEELLRELKRAVLSAVNHATFVLNSDNGLDILVNMVQVGSISVVSPASLSQWKIRRNPCVLYATINANELSPKQPTPYVSLPAFPESNRDTTFRLSKELHYAQLEEAIGNMQIDYMRQVMLTGTYRKDDELSVTLRFTYGSDDKTLTDLEVDTSHSQLLEKLQQKLPQLNIV